MQDRVPTNEKLKERDFCMPSICSCCHNREETTFHLFFQCDFALKMWSLLASIINYTFQFNSLNDIWALCDKHWTPWCKLTIQACDRILDLG